MDNDLTPIAAAYAVIVLVGLPLFAAFDERQPVDVARVSEQRPMFYLVGAVFMTILGLVTLGVAAWQGVAPEALRWRVDSTPTVFVWSLAIAAGGLGLYVVVRWFGHVAGLRESAISPHLIPRTATEKRGFLLFAGVGAIGAEYVFRGYAMWALTEWTGRPWVALVLVAISFGLSQGVRQVLSVLRGTLASILLAVAVLWTDSLFPAIVGHFWINAAIGLGAWKYIHGPPAATDPARDPRENKKDE